MNEEKSDSKKNSKIIKIIIPIVIILGVLYCILSHPLTLKLYKNIPYFVSFYKEIKESNSEENDIIQNDSKKFYIDLRKFKLIKNYSSIGWMGDGQQLTEGTISNDYFLKAIGNNNLYKKISDKDLLFEFFDNQNNSEKFVKEKFEEIKNIKNGYYLFYCTNYLEVPNFDLNSYMNIHPEDDVFYDNCYVCVYDLDTQKIYLYIDRF